MKSSAALRAKRSAVLLCTTVLAASALVATPAGAATSGPYVAYVSLDSTGNRSLLIGAPDGSTASPTPLVGRGNYVNDYAVSQHGATPQDAPTLAVSLIAGTTAGVNTNDSNTGLVVTRGGETRVLSTWLDTGPDISPDGSHVYFITDGNLYDYQWATNTTTALTVDAPFSLGKGPEPREQVFKFAMSPDASQIALLWVHLGTSATPDYSAVQVDSLATTPHKQTWIAQFSGAGAEVGRPDLTWKDANNIVFPVCQTSTCDAWSFNSADVTLPTNSATVMTGLDDFYGVRPLDSTWYMWKDTAGSTAFGTTSDLATPPTTFTARPDGATTGLYQPTDAIPSAVTKASNRATSRANLVMSNAVVPSGRSVVYAAYQLWLVPVGNQTFSNDAQECDRGTLQYSFNGGRTYHTLRVTSGAKLYGWPGNPNLRGNGKTQALTRNTTFRWFYSGDVFATPATSKSVLVKVAPAITIALKKKSSTLTVWGHVARIGGTMTLYHGSTKLAHAHISTKGIYVFAPRTFTSGSYKLVASPDANWTTSSKTFKVN